MRHRELCNILPYLTRISNLQDRVENEYGVVTHSGYDTYTD